jgi:hypothetical protein
MGIDPLTTVDLSSRETIAKNRSLPVTDPQGIPAVSDEFKPTPIEARRTELRTIPGKSEEEALSALQELGEKGSELAKDLGPDAPDPAKALTLKERRTQLAAAKARAQAQLIYLSELEDIVISDIVDYLGVAGKEYAHVVSKRPNLKSNYPKLDKFSTEHSRSVREGIARQKSNPKTPKK